MRKRRAPLRPAHRTGRWDGAAGTVGIGSTIAQALAHVDAKTSASRASSASCSVSGRRVRIDARGGEDRAGLLAVRLGTRRQSVPEDLAALREHRPDHLPKERVVRHRHPERTERQPDDRRMHPGRGPERARRERHHRGRRPPGAASGWPGRRSLSSRVSPADVRPLPAGPSAWHRSADRPPAPPPGAGTGSATRCCREGSRRRARARDRRAR